MLEYLQNLGLDEFKVYFTENYVSINKQWPYAYRKENLHRNLKYLYFGGKKLSAWTKNEGIVSNTENNEKYYIHKNSLEDNCCFIKCNFCNICIHRYKCTCMDFLIRSIICKHIHYFVLTEAPVTDSYLTESQTFVSMFQTVEFL
nr:unnamed protein product [Callosobruchus analis]